MPLITALLLIAAQAAPPTPGTIAVPLPVHEGKPIVAAQPFATAIEDALTNAGYTRLPPDARARYVVSFELARTPKGAVRTPDGGGGEVSGSTESRTVSIGLPWSKDRVGQLMATELRVVIRRRDEAAVAWEGRAVTQQVTGTRADQPEVLAERLATGLFRGFPHESGLTISVP